MHLTNYAVNKQSKDFQGSEGLANHDEGSKRSVSSVFWQIEQSHGVTCRELWRRISALVANTLTAMRPGLLEHSVQNQNSWKPLHPLAPKGFQILGLDILFNSQLQAQLLELNANPSLSIMQPGSPDPADDAPCPPAGSALQAARADRDSYPFGSAAGAGVPEIPQDSAPRSSSREDDIISRIVLKLRSLPVEELLAAESHVDAILATSSPVVADAERTSHSPVSAPGGTLVTNESAAGSARAPPRRTLEVTPQRTRSKSPGTSNRVSSISAQAKQRLGLGKTVSEEKPRRTKRYITSPLDLEIKRELVAQALLLARPAPMVKVSRLRKQWLTDVPSLREVAPLDDAGEWVKVVPEELRPEVRSDAPERCPALEALDFEGLVTPDVLEYSRSHLALYRAWFQGCGPAQSTLGQAQLVKLLERRGFVGPKLLFQERLAAQLWLTKIWRSVADGAFGLDFVQFVHVVGRIGDLLLAGDEAAEAGAAAESHALSVRGVLEFTRRGGADAE